MVVFMHDEEAGAWRRGADDGGRTVFPLREHEDLELPADMIGGGGALELYEEVGKRVEVRYRRQTGRFAIRSGGWVGYMPLNDRYALNIQPRVPVANLERVLVRSGDARVDTWWNRSRRYGVSGDRARTLYDILADRFLVALEEVWREGVLKGYVREEMDGAGPVGRIEPYGTRLLTQRGGRPRALFSAFVRTTDCPGNRVLRTAACRLRRWYEKAEVTEGHDERRRKVARACGRLQAIARPAKDSEITGQGIEAYIERLPVGHASYAGALRMAVLIVSGGGVGISGGGEAVALPVVLVDMADVFERYARQILRREADRNGTLSVRNGNVGGTQGGRVELFESLEMDGDRPAATPDIVVGDGEGVVAVVDVKYRPARRIPERSEINQVVTYGVRYNCRKVMILYPETPKGGATVSLIGKIGAIGVYRGSLDLGAENLDREERQSGSRILSSLGRDV